MFKSEGAVVLAEALRDNNTLSTLNLFSMYGFGVVWRGVLVSCYGIVHLTENPIEDDITTTH